MYSTHGPFYVQAQQASFSAVIDSTIDIYDSTMVYGGSRVIEFFVMASNLSRFSGAVKHALACIGSNDLILKPKQVEVL